MDNVLEEYARVVEIKDYIVKEVHKISDGDDYVNVESKIFTIADIPLCISKDAIIQGKILQVQEIEKREKKLLEKSDINIHYICNNLHDWVNKAIKELEIVIQGLRSELTKNPANEEIEKIIALSLISIYAKNFEEIKSTLEKMYVEQPILKQNGE